jgi:peptide deformylase
MSILKVARMGNPVLRRVADPIPPEHINSPAVQHLIGDMLDTVVEYDGVGLAAPQVHQSVRLVVLCLDPEEGFEAWINPVLTPTTDEEMITTEGCLSVPDLRGDVSRPIGIKVEAYDHLGQFFERHLDGFSAVVAQHECDHLDGVLYVDKADPRTLSFLEEFRRYAVNDEEMEE